MGLRDQEGLGLNNNLKKLRPYKPEMIKQEMRPCDYSSLKTF